MEFADIEGGENHHFGVEFEWHGYHNVAWEVFEQVDGRVGKKRREG